MKERLHPPGCSVRKVLPSAPGAPCAQEALGLLFSERSKDKRPREHSPLGASPQAASSTPPPAQQSVLQPLAACLHAGAAQEAFGSGEPPEGSLAGRQHWEGQEEPGPVRSEATKRVLQPQLCLTVGASTWTLELPAASMAHPRRYQG